MIKLNHMRNINFKKLVLVLSIIIVLNLFFNYGIDTFYKNPEYDSFCKQELLSKQYQSKEECESVGGFWTSSQITNVPEKIAPIPETIDQKAREGWCDAHYTCRKSHEIVLNLYNRNVFIILVVLGIISIILGFFVLIQSDAVSLGFSFGGVLSFIIGTIRYWSAMNDYLRFIILGIALVILVWIGVKKLRE